MNKERIMFPLSSRIFLARAFVLDEINGFEEILRERRGNNLKFGSVDEFIKSEIEERRKALTDEQSLFNYLLGRYCFCLKMLNEKDFSVFSEREIRDSVNFLHRLLF